MPINFNETESENLRQVLDLDNVSLSQKQLCKTVSLILCSNEDSGGLFVHVGSSFIWVIRSEYFFVGEGIGNETLLFYCLKKYSIFFRIIH